MQQLLYCQHMHHHESLHVIHDNACVDNATNAMFHALSLVVGLRLANTSHALITVLTVLLNLQHLQSFCLTFPLVTCNVASLHVPKIMKHIYHYTHMQTRPRLKKRLGCREQFLMLLRLRYSSPLFRLPTAEAIQSQLRFHNTGPQQVQCMTNDDGLTAGMLCSCASMYVLQEPFM